MLNIQTKKINEFYEQWLLALQPLEKQELKDKIALAKRALLSNTLQNNVMVLCYGAFDKKEEAARDAFLTLPIETNVDATISIKEQGYAVTPSQVVDSKSMSCVFWVSTAENQMKAMQHIKILLPSLPTAIIVASDITFFKENIHAIDFPEVLDIQMLDSSLSGTKTLDNYLMSYFERGKANTIANAQALQAFLALDTEISAVLSRDLFDIANKKTLPQQEESVKQRSGMSISSPAMELKNRLSAITEQYEKRIIEQVSEQFQANTGEISKGTEQLIDQINYLADRKAGKNTIYFLPEDIKNQLLDFAKTRTSNFYATEMSVFNTFLSRLEDTALAFQREQKIQLSLSLQKENNNSFLEKTLEKNFRIQRNFETSMATKTPMEVLMGARKNYMMIIMMGSMLGMGSFIMKIRFSAMPVLVLILGTGIWKMMQNTKVEKEELLEKNLTSIRDALRSELRRSLNDTGRDLEKWLNEQLKNFADFYSKAIEQQITQNSSSSYGNKSPILLRLEKEESLLNDAIKSRKSRFESGIQMLKNDLVAGFGIPAPSERR